MSKFVALILKLLQMSQNIRNKLIIQSKRVNPKLPLSEFRIFFSLTCASNTLPCIKYYLNRIFLNF